MEIGKTELTELLRRAADKIADHEASTLSPRSTTRKELEDMADAIEAAVTVKINFWR